MPEKTAYRGEILHFLRYPENLQDTGSYQYFNDGLLIVEGGKIVGMGAYNALKERITSDVPIVDYSGNLIVPGFIDAHIHYPQTEAIAAYGEHLLDWLQNYIFPTEGKYNDKEYAKGVAEFFLKELLRNGTTTASVYSTIYPDSVDAFFESAEQLNMRIITGKILMDRNAPDYLLDKSLQESYEQSKYLINRWHGKGRLLYAITPRFAPTSTEQQLELTAKLMAEFPDVYMQTHLAENKKEVEFVKDLYPWSKDYTDVYDHFNLLGKKSLFCHTIYLSDREFMRFSETESVMIWSPTSNLFLGSGLFNLDKARENKNIISIATDMGGGSSFSMLRTLNEAYKVAALQDSRLSPLESFYYITLGNAKALSLEDKIGNFEMGKEADFLVLDLQSTPLIKYKMQKAKTLIEKLFNFCILGDDRAVLATYIYGEMKHCRRCHEE